MGGTGQEDGRGGRGEGERRKAATLPSPSSAFRSSAFVKTLLKEDNGTVISASLWDENYVNCLLGPTRQNPAEKLLV